MAIKTKFGNISKDRKGYYIIHSNEFGNRGKKLHRLIWEDFYGCEIPKGYVIHHKNGLKTDNCILNLQLMSEFDHNKLHNTGQNHPMYGKHHTESAKKKMSIANKGQKHKLESKISISKSKKNSTGYFRVSKVKTSNYKQGFAWVYRYVDSDGKRKTLTSTNIDKLNQKVIERGLEWIELNQET